MNIFLKIFYAAVFTIFSVKSAKSMNQIKKQNYEKEIFFNYAQEDYLSLEYAQLENDLNATPLQLAYEEEHTDIIQFIAKEYPHIFLTIFRTNETLSNIITSIAKEATKEDEGIFNTK